MSNTSPDFSFPLKSRYATIPDAMLQVYHTPLPSNTRPKVSRTPPNFGFKYFPTPMPSSSLEPQQAKPLLETTSTPSAMSTNQPLFLTIPLEIRLQIYEHVLRSSKIHHAHLAPLASEQPTGFEGMSTEEFHTIMLRPSYISNPRVRREDRSSLVSLSRTGEALEFLLRDERKGKPEVKGKMPTALLRSCKQIYGEVRLFPWEMNTFSFINWFWSGIYAAKQFSNGLKDWQREGMRLVGIEVLGCDLRVKGNGVEEERKGLRDWIELCGMWGGVREVRLCVKGSVVFEEIRSLQRGGGTNVEPGTSTILNKNDLESKTRSLLDINNPWVTEGILALSSLRRIEVAIEDEDTPRETKIQFCADLSSLLNSPRAFGGMDGEAREKETPPTRVEVLFRENVEVPTEVISNREFTWYGGEPGDDSIWGDD